MAVPAMFVSVGWFGITEDTGPWYALVGWLLFGTAVAIIAGWLVRLAFNKLFHIESSGF
jgi:hypothetical protein